MVENVASECLLQVVVAWSPAAGAVHERAVQVPVGASVADAVQAAGHVLQAQEKVGVWSRGCELIDPVSQGDRVEIYRPLTVDPKVARRERFAQQGARHAGLFSKRRPNSKAGY